MPSPITELNRIKQEELDEFFEEHVNDDGKPWNKKEWKDKREKLIGDECTWCGENEDDAVFQLHHYDEPEFDYEHEWQRVEDVLFIQSNAFSWDQHIGEPDNCPLCLSTNFYERKTKTPTYRCRRCDGEFESENEASTETLQEFPYPNVYADRSYYYDKLDWVKNNRSDLLDAFKDAYDAHWEKYLSLENTITICKRCHFMHHEYDMKICSECGDEYGEYRDDEDIEDYACWDCLIDLKGLVICKNCGDNWYNPEYTNVCRSCRN